MRVFFKKIARKGFPFLNSIEEKPVTFSITQPPSLKCKIHPATTEGRLLCRIITQPMGYTALESYNHEDMFLKAYPHLLVNCYSLPRAYYNNGNTKGSDITRSDANILLAIFNSETISTYNRPLTNHAI